jgi:hypothetical protein
MAHALGEMYYLAGLMDERRQIEMQQKGQQEQKQQGKGALVFISPRVPKEFDTVVPSDTGKPVNTIVNETSDTESDWCVIA